MDAMLIVDMQVGLRGGDPSLINLMVQPAG
jgi:hypothetical protein